VVAVEAGVVVVGFAAGADDERVALRPILRVPQHQPRLLLHDDDDVEEGEELAEVDYSAVVVGVDDEHALLLLMFQVPRRQPQLLQHDDDDVAGVEVEAQADRSVVAAADDDGPVLVLQPKRRQRAQLLGHRSGGPVQEAVVQGTVLQP
jgi:hypothetical protein